MRDERIDVEPLPSGAEADPPCAECGRVARSRWRASGRRVRFRRGRDVLCLDCAGPRLDRAGLLLALSIAIGAEAVRAED